MPEMDVRGKVEYDFRGSRGGRLRRLAASTALMGTLPLGALMASQRWAPEDLAVLATCLGPFAVVYGWAWLRVWKSGVACGHDSLQVVGWWRSRELDKRTIVRARARPYRGWLYVFGWPVVSGSWESGVLEIEISGDARTLGGTVTSLRSARRDAEQINRWRGLELGAGTGPRRGKRTFVIPTGDGAGSSRRRRDRLVEV